MQKSRSISAWRVNETLEHIGECFLPHRAHILFRMSNFTSSFFIVGEQWRTELNDQKQVTLLAECMRSEESGQVSLERYEAGGLTISTEATFDLLRVLAKVTAETQGVTFS